jgi:hypothetical protein
MSNVVSTTSNAKLTARCRIKTIKLNLLYTVMISLTWLGKELRKKNVNLKQSTKVIVLELTAEGYIKVKRCNKVHKKAYSKVHIKVTYSIF